MLETQNSEKIVFSDSLAVKADKLEFEKVKTWLETCLDKADIQGKPRKQVLIVVDEIFTNIASYAYQGGEGEAVITFFSYHGDPDSVVLKFEDEGQPYNPLIQPEPDIRQRIEEKKNVIDLRSV